MSARAGKKAIKKTTAKRAVRKKVVNKKAGRKKAGRKKADRKKAGKKKAVRKKTKKPSATKTAQKPPLTAEEKKARVQQRAAERKFLKQSRVRLLSRRAALIEAYHSAKGNTKTSTAGGTEDYIDYAVSSYERDFSLSMTELERKQLLLVEEALARIRRAEFGPCLNCGVVIPQRRLEVEAWARYCIACQELDDQGLLQEPSFENESDDEDAEDDKGSKDYDEDDDEVV